VFEILDVIPYLRRPHFHSERLPVSRHEHIGVDEARAAESWICQPVPLIARFDEIDIPLHTTAFCPFPKMR